MIEQNKEMFDLGVKIMAFSFAEPSADMGDIGDLAEEKEEIIEQFCKVMGIHIEEAKK